MIDKKVKAGHQKKRVYLLERERDRERGRDRARERQREKVSGRQRKIDR